jgi:hypothetical protein
MIIPYDELAPETLDNLIEEFITREGTDYGMEEVPLKDKVAQVKRQLHKGEAYIIYSEYSESCSILSKEQAMKIYR